MTVQGAKRSAAILSCLVLSFLVLSPFVSSTAFAASAMARPNLITPHPHLAGHRLPLVGPSPQNCTEQIINGVEIIIGVAPPIPSLNPHGAKYQAGKLRGNEVNPQQGYSCEPAPMGIADYGVGSNGPYEYATNSSLGIIGFNQLVSSLMTIQLNVVLDVNIGSTIQAYWVQDVATIQPYSLLGPCETVCTTNPAAFNGISYEDNIWNLTAPGSGGPMDANEVSSPNGTADGTYYCCGNSDSSGGDIQLSFPTTVYMRVNSTVNNLGQPVVTYQYNDGVGGWQTYDTVVFLMKGVTSVPGYVVNGFELPPIGAPLFWDAELTLGGYGDGLYTVNGISDLQMGLMYFNGHNYQMIKNAWNHGGNTAESITNVNEAFDHYADNGTLYAEVNETPTNLGSLWNVSQVSLVTIQTSLASGFFAITNKGESQPLPSEYGFAGGQLTATMFPGTFVFKLFTTAGVLYKSVTVTVGAGQSTSLS